MKYKLTIRELNVEGAIVYLLAIHFTAKTVFHIPISKKHCSMLTSKHNIKIEKL
jgi:hypothetical protein